VWDGELVSTRSDWDSGLGADNSPDDVTVLSGLGVETSYADYSTSESFTCSTDAEVCEQAIPQGRPGSQRQR